jgi:sialic acid synthase SpsE
MFEKVFIIAEAGSNHNGDLDTAVQLIHRAGESGADAVKFQDFTLRSLFAVRPYEEALQIADHGWQTEIERLSVKPDWHAVLTSAAAEAGVHYFSTPFSPEAVDTLDPHVPFFKIASGDITHLNLLKRVATSGKGIFLSTGGSHLDEVERAVRLLEKYSPPFLCIMHCIMLYPPPAETLNLNYLDVLNEHFDHTIGLSDHTTGFEAAVLAIAKGARSIEKHFTLDSNQEGLDHHNSLNPAGLSEFASLIRRCETMLGNRERPMSQKEATERVLARRGIYAARNLRRGEGMSLVDVDFLRPNIGIGAENFGKLKKLRLNTDVTIGNPLLWSMFD